MIYCINPSCEFRENLNEATICASCGTPLHINNRLTLINLLSADTDTEIFEVVDNLTTFSGTSGSHKVLKVLKNYGSQRLQAFHDEAAILQNLLHDGIPKVDATHDFFSLDVSSSGRKVYCIVMTMFEGITLEHYIEENGAISQKKAINFLQQMGEILHYIQTEEIGDDDIGVIHRDIKPSNIIIQPSGKLALIDFGFALIISDIYRRRLKQRELARVQSGLYTPIEQIEQRPILQSDYYALGMTMIFAVTGKQLYTIEHKKNSWDLEWQKYVKLDKPFVQLLEQLTEQNYVKRPTSPDDLIRLLNQTLPEQLKLYSRYRSKTFRISALVIVALVFAGLFQIGRTLLSGHFIIEGNKAIDEGRFDDAKSSFEMAVNIYPRANAYNNLGVACSRLGYLDCQEQSHLKAIELDPNDWFGYHRLGYYYEDALKPDYAKAEYYHRRAVNLSQSKVQLPISDLARLLLLNKKYDEAKTYINQGLALSKGDSEAQLRRSLGWYYYVGKEYNKAEFALKQAIEINPNLNGPHCLLAKVYAEQKKSFSDEAEDCITLSGKDLLNIEVLRWRKEWLDILIRKSAINMSS